MPLTNFESVVPSGLGEKVNLVVLLFLVTAAILDSRSRSDLARHLTMLQYKI